MQRPGGLGPVTPVVLNIIIINVIMYFGTLIFQQKFPDLMDYLVEWHPGANKFRPYQLLTSMFMHAGNTHILFNMLGLYMFGVQLEALWGPKRFFLFYMISGLSASFFNIAINEFITLPGLVERYSNFDPNDLRNAISPVLGASGAIMGVLLGFGMMFPDTIIIPLIPPIPMKAKYYVVLYGILELAFGVKSLDSQTQLEVRGSDNIAHFAHIGGMIGAFILIMIWRKRAKFYRRN